MTAHVGRAEHLVGRAEHLVGRASVPALALAAVLVAGCSGEPVGTAEVASPSAGPVDGDVLVVGLQIDPGNASPLVAPFQVSGMLTDLVQPGLVRRKIGPDGLEYEPALAESWTWADDGKTLTYTLREGLQWGDGTPLTSADVQFTHELIADEAVASNWFGTAKHIVAVEAPDPRTVVYRFDRARNPMLQQGYTIRGIVPKHVLADADRATLRGHASARDPLPSGPFRIAQWSPNERIVLEPNPAAPADWKPHLDRIVFKILPEYSTALLELQNGDVDLVLSVEPADVPTLRQDPRLSIVIEPAAAMSYIGYNLADPRFADRRVRLALTHALDRDKLMRDFSSVGEEVHGQACVGTVAPTLGAWHNAEIVPLAYDPALAGRLLDEAGWTDADGDGWREKGGERLRFSMMIQNGDQTNMDVAVRVQAAWKAVGVELEVAPLEAARFADRARAKEYEAMLWGFGANPKVDPSQEWRSDGPYNWFGYTNPAVDAKIDEGVASADLAASQAAFREVQRLVYEDQPVTFLFWQDSFLAVDSRFREARHNTFQAFFHAEDWWVPADVQKYRQR